MSQPVPDLVKKPSIIAVPEHVSSVIFGGGCGVAHVPLNGAVDCPVCFPLAQEFIYPPDPAAPAQEQPVANADVQPSPPAAVDASAPVAAAPAPDATAPVVTDASVVVDAGPAPAPTTRKTSSTSSAS